MHQCEPCEDYAKQADEIQPKAKAPRPKKEVAKKSNPKKIFEGATPEPEKDNNPKAGRKRRKRRSRKQKPKPT